MAPPDGENDGPDGQPNNTHAQQKLSMAPGIKPPPELTSMDKWKTWRQMWRNYMIVAKLNEQKPEYQTAVFLHSIGIVALDV